MARSHRPQAQSPGTRRGAVQSSSCNVFRKVPICDFTTSNVVVVVVWHLFTRMPTHYVLVMDVSGGSSFTDSIPSGQGRGSIHSIRRPSTDVRSVGSDYLRRTSLAKLSALPLEAPITKVGTYLQKVVKTLYVPGARSILF